MESTKITEHEIHVRGESHVEKWRRGVFARSIILFKQGPLSSQMMINGLTGFVCVGGLVKRSLWGQKHFYIFAK